MPLSEARGQAAHVVGAGLGVTLSAGGAQTHVDESVLTVIAAEATAGLQARA